MPTEGGQERHTDAVHCYAIRRVNPFLGVLQVMETEAGRRAVSANGLVWEIEPRTSVSDGWGSLNRHRHRRVCYRDGAWSATEGLVERPLVRSRRNWALPVSNSRLPS
jgi:hypothetical protein